MVKGQVSCCVRVAFWALIAVMVMSEMTITSVSGRYLPTRSQDDRLDRLRELLKDLLASQQYDYAAGEGGANEAGSSYAPSGAGRGSGGHSVIFKREIPSYPAGAVNSFESTRMV